MGKGDNMKKVLIRGPLLSISGYGIHTRQIFKWLIKQPGIEVFCEILPWGQTSWNINPDSEGGIIRQIMKRSSTPNMKFDLTIQNQLPSEWNPALGNVNVGVSAWVESDRCNSEWIQAANSMDHLVVPSQFTKSVMMNSGNIMKKVSVIPESFHEDLLTSKNLNIDFTTSFNFLIVGTITGGNHMNDRKNIWNTIRWICEEFKENKDVGIVLKVSQGRGTKLDWPAMKNSLIEALRQIRPGQFPKVHLINGMMTNEEVCGLLKHESVKALVTATRGEGWGLPILEAAACGLPVIATNWSGHLDFMNHGKFIKLEPQIVEIHSSRVDQNIWMKGSKWAEVSEQTFKTAVRKFYNKPELPKQFAKELQAKIIKNFSQEEIEKRWTEELGYLIK